LVGAEHDDIGGEVAVVEHLGLFETALEDRRRGPVVLCRSEDRDDVGVIDPARIVVVGSAPNGEAGETEDADRDEEDGERTRDERMPPNEAHET
jgi:hypothetical protein